MHGDVTVHRSRRGSVQITERERPVPMVGFEIPASANPLYGEDRVYARTVQYAPRGTAYRPLVLLPTPRGIHVLTRPARSVEDAHALVAGDLCEDDGSGCCSVCRVMLDDCPSCLGRGYHRNGCKLSEAS